MATSLSGFLSWKLSSPALICCSASSRDADRRIVFFISMYLCREAVIYKEQPKAADCLMSGLRHRNLIRFNDGISFFILPLREFVKFRLSVYDVR